MVDGTYRLTIDGTKITRNGQQLDSNADGVAGDTFVLGAVASDNFYAWYADIDGDGVLGIVDFGQFRNTFGKTSSMPGFDPRFDYDADGVIGIIDFGQFRARFGKPKPT